MIRVIICLKLKEINEYIMIMCFVYFRRKYLISIFIFRIILTFSMKIAMRTTIFVEFYIDQYN
jgi:hypothetical protein